MKDEFRLVVKRPTYVHGTLERKIKELLNNRLKESDDLIPEDKDFVEWSSHTENELGTENGISLGLLVTINTESRHNGT